jgi:hypothetical protein
MQPEFTAYWGILVEIFVFFLPLAYCFTELNKAKGVSSIIN